MVKSLESTESLEGRCKVTLKLRLWRLLEFVVVDNCRMGKKLLLMGKPMRVKRVRRLCNLPFLKLEMIVDRMCWLCNSFLVSGISSIVWDWIYIFFHIGLPRRLLGYERGVAVADFSVVLLMYSQIRFRGICWGESMLTACTNSSCVNTLIRIALNFKRYIGCLQSLKTGSVE